MKRAIACIAGVGLVAGWIWLPQVSRASSSGYKVVRLDPAKFTDLPKAVSTHLKKRGCTIPQHVYSKKRHNVIQGEFARPGQTDWAVLCSIRGVSSILVFWNGSAENVASLSRLPDDTFIQNQGGDKWGYSRGIGTARKEFVASREKVWGMQVWGGHKPIPSARIDHEGIADAYIEKGSTIHYLYRGRWMEILGTD